MAQQWPTTAPTVSPGTHDPVATQAYMAGGGDCFRSGYYSHGLFTSAATSTLAMSPLGRVHARAFIVPVRRDFDRIGVNVTTAAAAASGGLLRMGLYGHVDGLPSGLIVDGGTVSSESTGSKAVVVAVTLEPGIYWLAVVSQVATCTVTAVASATATPWVSSSTSAPSATTGAVGFTDSTNTVSGALLSSPTWSNNTGAVPYPALRAA